MDEFCLLANRLIVKSEVYPVFIRLIYIGAATFIIKFAKKTNDLIERALESEQTEEYS